MIQIFHVARQFILLLKQRFCELSQQPCGLHVIHNQCLQILKGETRIVAWEPRETKCVAIRITASVSVYM